MSVLGKTADPVAAHPNHAEDLLAGQEREQRRMGRALDDDLMVAERRTTLESGRPIGRAGS